MIISIPPKLLATLRAQQISMNQMLQGWCLGQDIPEGTAVELHLEEGYVSFPDPQETLESDIERFLKPVDN